MSSRKKRKCIICGKEYKYCPTCSEDADKPTWYFICCCETCHEINDILSQHTAGRITSADAKAKLEKIDITNIASTDDRNHIKEILCCKSKPVKKKALNEAK